MSGELYPVVAAMPDPVAPDAQWRRLSPRMLLIHPIREVGRAIPALVGIFFASSSSGHSTWSALALIPVVGLSMLRWFTTRYRISPDQLQLRTGLLPRRTMSTPADRVRTVDVTAHALHRALGLTRVVIGTGISDRKREGLVLDGLTAEAAGRLRAELLHRLVPAGSAVPAVQPAVQLSVPQLLVAEQRIAELDPRWVRYAPFTLSGAVTALAILGFAWRIIDQTQVSAGDVSAVRSVTDHLRHTPIWLDAVQLSLGGLLAVTVLSVLGYLLAFWNFRLTRHSGGSLHISRGLITTRATSIEERRLRGVELSELLPLRLVGGARLLAVATGLRVGRGAERGGSLLLPASPLAEARRVSAEVLNDPASPIDLALQAHGPIALRRRYVRAVLPAVLVTAGLVWLASTGRLAGWLAATALLLPVLAVLLARDRYRSLGHARTGRYLHTQFGSLVRRRVLLQTEGIIGWNLRESFFQRRAGLATLTATTAAGRQSYRVTDLALPIALELADAAVPGLLTEFLVHPSDTIHGS
ncbi:MAG: PH domain-containing protein [Jatrophihabitantaceae bacterium]